MAASAANAQTAATPSGSAQDSVDDIVVTGSRVVRTGFDAPTPTTVLTSEELEQRGSAQIGEFLIEAPAFRGTQTPQDEPAKRAWCGSVLRRPPRPGQHSHSRSGRRPPLRSLISRGAGRSDLIPSVMVSRGRRRDGCASAQWGSDAVAGVVNVILNNQSGRVQADLSYGESMYGDNQEVRASLAAGTDFAEGRGHVVVGGEYVKGDGVDSHYDRPFGRDLQEQVSYAGARLATQPSRFFAHACNR